MSEKNWAEAPAREIIAAIQGFELNVRNGHYDAGDFERELNRMRGECEFVEVPDSRKYLLHQLTSLLNACWPGPWSRSGDSDPNGNWEKARNIINAAWEPYRSRPAEDGDLERLRKVLKNVRSIRLQFYSPEGNDGPGK